MGDHHFEILPFLGPEKEGKNFRYDVSEIYSVSGEKLDDSLNSPIFGKNEFGTAKVQLCWQICLCFL